MGNEDIVKEVIQIAIRLNWKRESVTLADTGSIYIELTRQQEEQKEWIVIRVADHKQVYHKWLTTYSVSRFEIHPEELELILMKPFGQVGDIL